MLSKLIKIDKANEKLIFTNGVTLYSSHEQDCCEHHELTFTDLEESDFENLEFDFTDKDNKFLVRVPDYGIRLVPISGFSVSIPGHGYNNGYYGTNIDLVIDIDGKTRYIDVSECQFIRD